MVVRFIFKRVAPSVLVYYGGIQSYLVYHLVTSRGGVRLPNSPEVRLQPSIQNLVKDILSVYQCKATSSSFAALTDDVQFEDPGGLTSGKENFQNIAYMMRAFLKSETLSLREHHYEDKFILELHQKYTVFGGFEVKLPSVVYVQLEGKNNDQKVKEITEEWFGVPLITPENAPFLYTGVTSRFFRRLHGKLSNIKFDEPR